MSNYQAYWDTLVKNSSSRVKEEYERTERRSATSFQSVGDILRKDFGYQGKS